MSEAAIMFPDMVAPATDPVALTPEEAKHKVFEHWQRLGGLARRRFPKDENSALAAGDFVLAELTKDGCQRVRAWQGKGEFLPFLVTVASHLLTDFARTIPGYPRIPEWVKEQGSLWETGYWLLIVERHPPREAVEWLMNAYPERERWFIKEVVRTIGKRCRTKSQPVVKVGIGDTDLVCPRPGLEEQLEKEQEEMLKEVLRRAYLHDESDTPIHPRASELLSRLREHLHLTEQDRLLLRLRFQDGMTMQAIARLLHLQGDPYKRLNKLIAELRRTCQRVGFCLE